MPYPKGKPYSDIMRIPLKHSREKAGNSHLKLMKSSLRLNTGMKKKGNTYLKVMKRSHKPGKMELNVGDKRTQNI